MRIFVGALLALGVGLSGCGSSNDTTGVPSCPRTAIIADAARLVQYGAGAARDSQAVSLEARLISITGECVYPKNKSSVTVNMNLTIGARRGADVNASAVETVGYFVAVVDSDQRIIARAEFAAPIEFKSGVRQSGLIEELEQKIPLPAGKAAASFDVLVGFLLTPEQVNLNRAAQR